MSVVTLRTVLRAFLRFILLIAATTSPWFMWLRCSMT